MNKKTIRDVSLKGKRVLIRVDFNVPLDKEQRIEDDTRIRESIPTINFVSQAGGRVILMSHLGRPKGKTLELSLAPVAKRLSESMGLPVKFSSDCISEEAMRDVNSLQDGDILLLENLRFYKEEEANDEGFSKKLAEYGEIYVNDAFGTAHRAHASTEGVTHYIKTAVAGLLIEKELKYLGEATDHPARPFVAILGGSKISGKIDVLEKLLEKVDTVLVGGAMIFTFFRALGLKTGKSLVEDDKIDLAKSILEKAKVKNVSFLLPTDVVIADNFDANANSKTVSVNDIADDWMGLDIGKETIKSFQREIVNAKTVVWNGPMGVFEIEKFAIGTYEVAKALADATSSGAITIVGGGDSASAIVKSGLEKRVSHVSTGGGASLEFLEGKILPGIAALNDK